MTNGQKLKSLYEHAKFCSSNHTKEMVAAEAALNNGCTEDYLRHFYMAHLNLYKTLIAMGMYLSDGDAMAAEQYANDTMVRMIDNDIRTYENRGLI